MTQSNAPDTVPDCVLYTMLRVRDLDTSIAFYRDGLGMSELRRETFPEGRFTLVFMGYENRPHAASIELTWNWDDSSYSHGSGFGHVAVMVSDIYGACARLASMGVKILRDPGPMKYAPQESGVREQIAFVADPDGYKIELIGRAELPARSSQI